MTEPVLYGCTDEDNRGAVCLFTGSKTVFTSVVWDIAREQWSVDPVNSAIRRVVHEYQMYTMGLSR